MKLLHLVSFLGTTLSLTRAADYDKPVMVNITGPTATRNEMCVFAKQYSEGVPVDMNVPSTNEPMCLDDPDPKTNVCPPEQEYIAITNIYFDRPTTDPRNITVNFKDYTIHCTFALNQSMDGRVVAWNIHRDWGLDGRKSDFEIKCDNSTAYYGEPYGEPEIVWPTDDED